MIQDPASTSGIHSTHSTFDPEIEDIVDLKCAIKDVDCTIKSIRDWREEQKRNLDRNLQLNQEAYSHPQKTEDSGE